MRCLLCLIEQIGGACEHSFADLDGGVVHVKISNCAIAEMLIENEHVWPVSASQLIGRSSNQNVGYVTVQQDVVSCSPVQDAFPVPAALSVVLLPGKTDRN